MPTSIHMAAPPETYRARRSQLARQLERPVVVFAGRAPARNYPANTFPFRPGSSYSYFGGPPIEGAAWVIEPGSDGAAGVHLLRPPAEPDDAFWIGEAPDDAALAAAAAVPPKALRNPDALPGLLHHRPAAFIAPPCRATSLWIAQMGLQPAEPSELSAVIELRLIKDDHELTAMRRAAQVTVEAHRAALAATRAAAREADVAAAFHAVLVARECRPAFSPIITVRGEVLHGHGHPHTLEDGQLLLVDGGAEEAGGYACDVTRTCAVSGAFSDLQGQLYQTVLQALTDGIAACVVGARYRDIHDLAATRICEGLGAVGLLKGDAADLVARKAHTLFFPHGVGHLIGQEAHEMEDFGDLAGYGPGYRRRPGFGDKYLRLDRDLRPGMCVTVEPGVYLVPAIWQRPELISPLSDVIDRRAVDALLAQRFGGIRIEETIHIREGAPEVLSAALPSTAAAVNTAVGRRA